MGEVPIEHVQATTQSTDKSDEKKSVWSKKERIFLDSMAVLGLINMIAFFVTQSSFVRDNIYWVYGLFTLADIISFLIGYGLYDSRRHKRTTKVPAKFMTFLWLSGLWMFSVPIAIVGYYFGVADWIQVGMVAWGASLVASGIYDVAYLMTIVGFWLTKGMEFE